MKLKKPLIIGGILSVAGVALMCATFNESNFNISWEKGKGLETVSVRKNQQNFAKNDIKNVDLNVKNQQVTLKQGDTDSWQVKTTSWGGKQSSVNVKDGTLHVTAKDNTQDNMVMMFGDSDTGFSFSNYDEESDTTIVVPRDVKISQINVTGKDGGVIMDDFKADQIKVQMQDGGARIRNIQSKSLNMNSSDGRMYVENSTFDKMQVTGRDMGVSGSGLKLNQASSINLRDGHVAIDKVQVPGYNLHAKSEITFESGAKDKDGNYINLDKDDENNTVKRGNQQQALTINANYSTIALSEHAGLPDDSDDDDSDDASDY
ncbi:hypothetical protein WVI01_06270 [Weissella viridescens]|uniref:DUF4097 domain-containing protein n=1 Tax=Weissella viridescens TaxID=1629 RepID=A0A0R2HAN2_WEIVI|nr:DUF4097 family beta strand repeat-containing protein [Weissella viridescens]KRN47148.1 hypothetical protein IV50_GL000419 [Weissella viridescens]GEA94704.1 hypothetical protein WVI01_06270 [Weissella viridescens]